MLRLKLTTESKPSSVTKFYHVLGLGTQGQGRPSPYLSQGEIEKHRNPFTCFHSLLGVNSSSHPMPGAPRGAWHPAASEMALYTLVVHAPAVMDVKQVKQMNRQDKYKL